MRVVEDKYGRSFKTLRVSLLNRCNLACVYCNVGNGNEKTSSSAGQLPVTELLDIIARLHSVLQLQTIRLTGGEPLLYSGLIHAIAGIHGMGIDDIKLTTNGFLLDRLAAPMKAAGMRSINVSLDAVDEDVFFLMSKRNDVRRVLRGIDAAISEGLTVKINAVLMKGINESQLIPLLEYAFERNIVIRFLEVMAMGHLHNNSKQYFVSQDEILSTIAARYSFDILPRKSSATSNYWKTYEGRVFGIIANESQPFCHDCNRLRLDSDGNIFGCLSSNTPISISGITEPSLLAEKLQQALSQKQLYKFAGSELSMLDIGG